MLPARPISELLADYANAAGLITRAIEGLSDADLRWKPPAGSAPELGSWSIGQILIHLQDADLAFADRFKRIIAMDNPVLQGWNENDYIACVPFTQQSAKDAVDVIRLLHAQASRVFQALPKEAFERTGVHSERGVQTLTDVLNYATWHVGHHVKFVDKKRKALGK